jgi:PhnB protein
MRKKIRTPDKDGTLIHAEVLKGDSMILLADAKEDWHPIFSANLC